MQKVEIFNDYKPARISKELYEIEKCRWRLSVPATRLLFALSQIVSEDNTEDLFPELGFSLDAMFKYLGLTKTNRKYELLAEALEEVKTSGLQLISKTKKGGTQWEGLTWINYYKFSTNEPLITIEVNNRVKPFLRQLSQYARIQPKIYLKLSSEYQNWFYPYFKQFENLGKWTVIIEDLKKSLMLEDIESYSASKNRGITNFLERVIGIELSPEAKAENTLSKKLKRPAKPIEWNYTKNARGEYTGTLFHISDRTDLNVTASCLKTGRSYTHIIFFISKKIIKKASRANIDSNSGADIDLQKPKRRKAKTKSDIKDIFASEFDECLYIPNPAYEKELPKRIAYYSDEQINEMAKASNRSVDHIVLKMNLRKDSKGRWFREY